MATYYVTAGSGGGDGSLATPWLGLAAIAWNGQDAVRAGYVSKGDTLYVLGDIPMGASWNIGNSGATSSDHTTIRGDYTGNPGSITFSGGNYYLNASRQYFDYIGLTTIQAGAYSNVYVGIGDQTFTNCTQTGGTTCFIFVTAADNVTIDGCTISGATGNNAAIRCLAGTGQTKAVDNTTIKNCTITNITGHGIEFRLQADSHADSEFLGVNVSNNTISSCSGIAIYIADLRATWESKDVIVEKNSITSCGTLGTAAGGGILVAGFDPSSAATYGLNRIIGNTITSVYGDNGGINPQNTTYLQVYNNVINGTESQNIDACGVLIDNGCDYVDVRCNECNNIRGYTSDNSGAGVMVLDAGHTLVHGNFGVGMRVGLWFDQAADRDIQCYYNDFSGITVSAVWMTAGCPAPANVVMKNNKFSGSGYSVKNLSSATADLTTDYNGYIGFSSGLSGQSALGTNDVTTAAACKVGGVWIAGARCTDDLPPPLHPDIGKQDRTAPGRRFGAGGGKR